MNSLDESVAAVGRWVDEAFVGFSLRGRPLDDAGRAQAADRLAAAAALYADPAARARLFADPGPPAPHLRQVSRFTDGEVTDLRWPSRYAPLHPEYADTLRLHPQTAVAHARWYRHHTPHPAVIILHGWGGGFYPLDALLYRVNWLFAHGLDVALLQAPFHAARAPAERLVPPMFPSYARPVRTIEGFAQSIADARSLLHHLAAHGVPAAGAFGMSMGGFTTALLATAEPSLAFAVAAIPFASLPDLAWDPATSPAESVVAASLGVSRASFASAFDAINPLSRAPAIAGPRLAVVYGTEDRVTPAAHAERLAAHFPGARLVPFPGAHIVQWGRQTMFETLLDHARAFTAAPPPAP